MSFLQIVPEELTAAATQLGALGTSLTAQNTAAAAPTTAIAPAALDEVSALQAALFTAYGTLYQQVSAEAAAMHDMFVNTLGFSAGTYGATESLNSAAADSPLSGLTSGISGLIGGTTGMIPDSFNGGFANMMNIGMGNWASATSNLLGLAGGGLLPAEEAAAADSFLGGEAALGELGAAEAALGGGSVAAGIGEASAIGALSVPPSWAGQATLVSSTTAGALQGAGWTAAAPQAAPGMLYPGVPGLASAARNSAGFGAPRYGVKPIVMPKPVSV
ncbi:PPE family protein, SVP subgroup [Mycobacterium kansasii]|uniref:PE family protein n=3 Tax=Mycobacterium kansasii TaxID=1768 RepID=A0A1V3XPB4_MYCKA|nr:PE domain-containing protein [Mycobacterium kansasii]EUA01126.1 PE family protein [Mycobacterium kansasii 824]AGZ50285.1 PE family protein [Mycobacterium kansasii ATCC 12478]ARG57877.1 PE family protein [Mycobacterium kansasii]ARG63391.1 PE family protein [Mycobacterium kansasii]ARG71028.1 PE family protein [Mycobacterium kansasii]